MQNRSSAPKRNSHYQLAIVLQIPSLLYLTLPLPALSSTLISTRTNTHNMLRTFAIFAFFTLISSVFSAMIDLQALLGPSLSLEGNVLAGSAVDNSSGVSGAALSGNGSAISTASIGEASAGAVSTPSM